jgi:hypothetical protein
MATARQLTSFLPVPTTARLRRPGSPAARLRRPGSPAARPAPSPGLAVVASTVRGVHRIDVSGELDLATVGQLEAAAARPRRRPWRRADLGMVLDLTGVTFVDVVGVAALGRIHRQARGPLRVGMPVGPGPRRMLAVAVDSGWLAPAFRPDDPMS